MVSQASKNHYGLVSIKWKYETDNYRKKLFPPIGFHLNTCTATKIPFMYSQVGNCVASVPITCLFHVLVSDLYTVFPGSVHIFFSRIGRPILGIYKSLTGTCTWKLGLWLRNSFFKNLCFEFLVLCLCSVETFKF
jgi:hypothetical protein